MQKYVLSSAKPLRILVEEVSTNNADDIWITYNRNTLKHSDKKIIENGSQLTDKHIGLAQTLMRGQFQNKRVTFHTITRKVPQFATKFNSSGSLF